MGSPAPIHAAYRPEQIEHRAAADGNDNAAKSLTWRHYSVGKIDWQPTFSEPGLTYRLHIAIAMQNHDRITPQVFKATIQS
jgi:hypothetical protein